MDWFAYGSIDRGHFLSAPVSITFDGIDNDGMAGEKDSVASDFDVIGLTEFDDFIDVSGLPARRYINGWTGDDTIIGSASADTIYGDAGEDSITGGAAEDRLFGGVGNDTFLADDGFRDVIRGEEGTDSADTDVLDVTWFVETTS
jgi:Ca2+-binding RTX toxin-like protein